MDEKKMKIKLHLLEMKRIPIYLFLLYFLFVMVIYLKADFLLRLKKPSTYIIIVSWVVLTLLSLLENSRIRDFLKKHAAVTNGAVLLISPAASFLVVEVMVSNFNRDMFLHYSFYNLIWYVILYYFLFALMRDCKHTVAIGNTAVYIASMINYFVYLFRGNPILPSDLLAWQSGMSVASGYHISFSEGFLISTLIMYFVYTLGYKLEKTERKPSVINRTVVAVTLVILLDYVLAFTAIGAASFFGKPFKNRVLSVGFGAFCVSLIRFLCSFVSGIVNWADYVLNLLNGVKMYMICLLN
jgi:hypothetical protein